MSNLNLRLRGPLTVKGDLVCRDSSKIAVNIVDDRAIESLKVVALEP